MGNHYGSIRTWKEVAFLLDIKSEVFPVAGKYETPTAFKPNNAICHQQAHQRWNSFRPSVRKYPSLHRRKTPQLTTHPSPFSNFIVLHISLIKMTVVDVMRYVRIKLFTLIVQFYKYILLSKLFKKIEILIRSLH